MAKHAGIAQGRPGLAGSGRPGLRAIGSVAVSNGPTWPGWRVGNVCTVWVVMKGWVTRLAAEPMWHPDGRKVYVVVDSPEWAKLHEGAQLPESVVWETRAEAVAAAKQWVSEWLEAAGKHSLEIAVMATLTDDEAAALSPDGCLCNICLEVPP